MYIFLQKEIIYPFAGHKKNMSISFFKKKDYRFIDLIRSYINNFIGSTTFYGNHLRNPT